MGRVFRFVFPNVALSSSLSDSTSAFTFGLVALPRNFQDQKKKKSRKPEEEKKKKNTRVVEKWDEFSFRVPHVP